MPACPCCGNALKVKDIKIYGSTVMLGWREGTFHLRPQLAEVFKRLERARPRFVSVDDLIDEFWPEQPGAQVSMKVAISTLRSALADTGLAIENDRAIGYRLVETSALAHALKLKDRARA